jgi:hypothetical protein
VVGTVAGHWSFCFVPAESASERHFLWFWQQNPGKSFSGLWKLSHVALTDAAVLAFLTVLVMRITWWETSRAERSELIYIDMVSALEFHFLAVRNSKA